MLTLCCPAGHLTNSHERGLAPDQVGHEGHTFHGHATYGLGSDSQSEVVAEPMVLGPVKTSRRHQLDPRARTLLQLGAGHDPRVQPSRTSLHLPALFLRVNTSKTPQWEEYHCTSRNPQPSHPSPTWPTDTTTQIVPQSSAVLQGVDSQELSCTHSELPKFKSPTEARFETFWGEVRLRVKRATEESQLELEKGFSHMGTPTLLVLSHGSLSRSRIP